MPDIKTVNRGAIHPTGYSKPFWEAAKHGRLLLQFCPEAKLYQHFPRPVSLYTGKRNLEWREVSGRGVVYAVTVTRRGPPAFNGAEPYLVATIQLDEGVRFMSNLVNCPVESAHVGLRVKPFWQKGEGDVTYLLFEPDKDPAGPL
jgi:uncharacterized OB-fold protein